MNCRFLPLQGQIGFKCFTINSFVVFFPPFIATLLEIVKVLKVKNTLYWAYLLRDKDSD